MNQKTVFEGYFHISLSSNIGYFIHTVITFCNRLLPLVITESHILHLLQQKLLNQNVFLTNCSKMFILTYCLKQGNWINEHVRTNFNKMEY